MPSTRPTFNHALASWWAFVLFAAHFMAAMEQRDAERLERAHARIVAERERSNARLRAEPAAAESEGE